MPDIPKVLSEMLKTPPIGAGQIPTREWSKLGPINLEKIIEDHSTINFDPDLDYKEIPKLNQTEQNYYG